MITGSDAPLTAAFGQLLETGSSLPGWPFLTSRGFATLFEFGEVETPEFGHVLAALATHCGDEWIDVAPLAVGGRTAGPEIVFRAQDPSVQGNYWSALREADGGSDRGPFLGIADTYAVAGSSGAWALWAQRDWDIAVLLAPDDDGPWLHTDVPWWPRDAHLPDLRGPIGWVESLNPDDLGVFAAHLDERGGGTQDRRPRRWEYPRLRPALILQAGNTGATFPRPFGRARSRPQRAVWSVDVAVDARLTVGLELIVLGVASLTDVVDRSGGFLPGWPHLMVDDGPRDAAHAHLAGLVATCGADWSPDVLEALRQIGRLAPSVVEQPRRFSARFKLPRPAGRVTVDNLEIVEAATGGWWVTAAVAFRARGDRDCARTRGTAVTFRVLTPRAARQLVSEDCPAQPAGGLLLVRTPNPDVIAQAIASQMAPFAASLDVAAERFTMLAQRVGHGAGLR